MRWHGRIRNAVIRHPSSVIRHPSSVIRHPSSVIRHPFCKLYPLVRSCHCGKRKFSSNPMLRLRSAALLRLRLLRLRSVTAVLQERWLSGVEVALFSVKQILPASPAMSITVYKSYYHYCCYDYKSHCS